LTEPIESSGRRGGDQIKEMELKLHPDLKGPLKALCENEHTIVVVLSGSDRSVLDEVITQTRPLSCDIILLITILPIRTNIFLACRILGNSTCGWQQSMGCFYVLLTENG
jgi:hypothetical protein